MVSIKTHVVSLLFTACRARVAPVRRDDGAVIGVPKIAFQDLFQPSS